MVLRKWYQFLLKDSHLLKPEIIIYLRSKLETVYQRMKDRMRAEETSVSLEYLIEINQFYESWLASPYSNSLVISENEQTNCHILILNGYNTTIQVICEFEWTSSQIF